MCSYACFTTSATQFYVQTPPKMAAGPAGPSAVSSNRTYSATPQSIPRYVNSGVTLGGQEADCCGHSFERFHLLNQTIALFERRSLAPIPFLGRNIWARLLFPYKSTYMDGILALFPSFVPTSWDQKAASRKCWFTVESAGNLPFPPRCKPIPQNQ